jgi:hypothetical protein
MDVQPPLNLFTTLNNAVRPTGPAAGASWAAALPLGPADPAAPAQGASQAPVSGKAFANLLEEAIEVRPTGDQASDRSVRERELREKFQVIVNKFFLGSMFKQMRSSPFKSEMFSGGKGGEAFQGLMDQHLAEHAGGKVAKSLVDVMVKRAMGTQGDPHQLYLDPRQQQRVQEYRQTTPKRVKHDTAPSFTA